MTDILIHKSSKYIKEDRDYYCSDIRDKHGMIKPSDDLISLSCDSEIIRPDIDCGELCSIYYPFEKHSFNRIYLGISFPLFANNWGAAFLRYLMYLIKKDGAVILPVYAERQGVEKNYWSRSSLEVMFQSRQKWWGMSNIWAENDGVMSMRIGKKEPPLIDSTINHLFDNEFQKANGSVDEDFIKTVMRHHNNATTSAIIEQIIINYHGRKKSVSLLNVLGDSLLPSEILMSDYVNVTEATQHFNQNSESNYKSGFLPESFSKNLGVIVNDQIPHVSEKKYDIITMIDSLCGKSENEKLSIISDLKSSLNKKGIVVIKDSAFDKKEFCEKIKNDLNVNELDQYSSIVAAKHIKDKKIAHYSDIIFDELNKENQSRQSVFSIIQF